MALAANISFNNISKTLIAVTSPQEGTCATVLPLYRNSWRNVYSILYLLLQKNLPSLNPAFFSGFSSRIIN